MTYVFVVAAEQFINNFSFPNKQTFIVSLMNVHVALEAMTELFYFDIHSC